jgi:hypothetical protein
MLYMKNVTANKELLIAGNEFANECAKAAFVR